MYSVFTQFRYPKLRQKHCLCSLPASQIMALFRSPVCSCRGDTFYSELKPISLIIVRSGITEHFNGSYVHVYNLLDQLTHRTLIKTNAFIILLNKI